MRLSAYDVLGRQVTLIHDSALPAGSYTFPFVAEGLPTGKYFVRAMAQSIERTLTVTLVSAWPKKNRSKGVLMKCLRYSHNWG